MREHFERHVSRHCFWPSLLLLVLDFLYQNLLLISLFYYFFTLSFPASDTFRKAFLAFTLMHYSYTILPYLVLILNESFFNNTLLALELLHKFAFLLVCVCQCQYLYLIFIGPLYEQHSIRGAMVRKIRKTTLVVRLLQLAFMMTLLTLMGINGF